MARKFWSREERVIGGELTFLYFFLRRNEINQRENKQKGKTVKNYGHKVADSESLSSLS